MGWLLNFHGLFAIVALYAGYRLREALLTTNRRNHSQNTRLWSVVVLATMGLVFASGTWLYAAYRRPGGARDWLLENSPAWHTVWFEFKEHLGLMGLLMAGALGAFALNASTGKSSGVAVPALAVPALATLLFCLLVSALVGSALSFCVRTVSSLALCEWS